MAAGPCPVGECAGGCAGDGAEVGSPLAGSVRAVDAGHLLRGCVAPPAAEAAAPRARPGALLCPGRTSGSAAIRRHRADHGGLPSEIAGMGGLPRTHLGHRELGTPRRSVRSTDTTAPRSTPTSASSPTTSASAGSTCVSAGTAAIHSAIGALDLEPGSEVIVSSFTDPGSVMPLLFQQLVPVFVEHDFETFLMSPDGIRAAITPYTKAIIVAQLHGYVADMEAIDAIAAEHDLPVIGDVSQAHGSTVPRQPVRAVRRHRRDEPHERQAHGRGRPGRHGRHERRGDLLGRQAVRGPRQAVRPAARHDERHDRPQLPHARARGGDGPRPAPEARRPDRTRGARRSRAGPRGHRGPVRPSRPVRRSAASRSTRGRRCSSWTRTSHRGQHAVRGGDGRPRASRCSRLPQRDQLRAAVLARAQDVRHVALPVGPRGRRPARSSGTTTTSRSWSGSPSRCCSSRSTSAGRTASRPTRRPRSARWAARNVGRGGTRPSRPFMTGADRSAVLGVARPDRLGHAHRSTASPASPVTRRATVRSLPATAGGSAASRQSARFDRTFVSSTIVPYTPSSGHRSRAPHPAPPASRRHSRSLAPVCVRPLASGSSAGCPPFRAGPGSRNHDVHAYDAVGAAMSARANLDRRIRRDQPEPPLLLNESVHQLHRWIPGPPGNVPHLRAGAPASADPGAGSRSSGLTDGRPARLRPAPFDFAGQARTDFFDVVLA